MLKTGQEQGDTYFSFDVHIHDLVILTCSYSQRLNVVLSITSHEKIKLISVERGLRFEGECKERYPRWDGMGFMDMWVWCYSGKLQIANFDGSWRLKPEGEERCFDFSSGLEIVDHFQILWCGAVWQANTFKSRRKLWSIRTNMFWLIGVQLGLAYVERWFKKMKYSCICGRLVLVVIRWINDGIISWDW